MTKLSTISTAETREKLNADIGVYVLNVLNPEWFKGELIPGSRWVPLADLTTKLKYASMPKDAQVIVYCAGPSCPASSGGSYGGFFAGPNGEGAGVAFTAGGAGSGVNGVVGFKR